MIYLDNAATTQHKPQEVITAVNDAITKYSCNPNRSGSNVALELQQKIVAARKKIAILLNHDSDERVVFTSGCTAALNLGILGNARRGHIIITCTEHNSVLRPAMKLKQSGKVDVTVLKPQANGEISAEDVAKAMRRDTVLVCVNHASNVTGKVQNLAEIGEVVYRGGALFMADCAQTAGYLPIDMQKCKLDLVALPAHKGLHGIQGVGALAFSERATPKPILFGGTGTESHLLTQPTSVPDGLEAGTLPCPAILAMSAAISWWADNLKQNATAVRRAQRLLADGLRQIDKVKVYSDYNDSGIVAFNVGGVDSAEIADELNKRDIAVRAGLHCAPLMHKWLGTYEQGAVRASASCVTTTEECCTFLQAVAEIAKKY